MDPNLAAAWGGWVMTPDGQMVRQPIGKKGISDISVMLFFKQSIILVLRELE